MRILHVIPQMWIGNGAAKILLNLISNQVKTCSLVDVICLVDVKPSLSEEVKSLGCGLKFLGSYRYNPYLIFKLKKEIPKYDIIHVHLFPALYWVAIAHFLVRSNAKLVLTEHSTKNNRQKLHFLKYIEFLIYRRYDKIVAVSNAVKVQLMRNGIPERKIEVIYNGISIQNIDKVIPINRSELDIPINAFLITQVARFYLQKDQATLIRSLKYLPNQFFVVFIGDGVLLQKHIELANSIGVLDRIRFLGIRNDVFSILKVSNIVVMSSNFEGFCLSALEGMAAEKPVIASNIPELSEVVKDAGLLFPLHDEKELASLIIKLYEDSDYYQIIAKSCKNRSLSFDEKIMRARYLTVYKKLVYND